MQQEPYQNRQYFQLLHFNQDLSWLASIIQIFVLNLNVLLNGCVHKVDYGKPSSGGLLS